MQPTPLHLRIDDNGRDLQIELTRRSRWYHQLLAALPVVWCGLGFLIFAAAAGWIAYIYYFTGKFAAQRVPTTDLVGMPILLMLMLGWPLLILSVPCRAFIATLIRRETAVISSTEWAVERDFGLWRSVRRFQAGDVSNVQSILVGQQCSLWRFMRLLFNEPGSITFSYGWRRVAFTSSATEAEARQIVSAVRHRFPERVDALNPAAATSARQSIRSRWSADQQGDALVLTIVGIRSWSSRLVLIWYMLFSVAWMALFGIILLQTAAAVGAPASFLVLTTFGELMGLYALVWSLSEFRWQLIGSESVYIDASGIRLQARGLWLSRPCQFMAAHIYGLRFDSHTYRPSERLGWFRQPGNWGTVAFDYGAATYRFGDGLNPIDAAEVQQLIVLRFPQFALSNSHS